MAVTTITSRDYNRNRSLADKSLSKGPVIITDRGRPAKVILSFEEYERLSGKKQSLVELLAMPEAGDFDFDPPRIGREAAQAADFE